MDAETSKSSLLNLFSYSNLVHAISGAAGSVVAISVFYPLDTVRTRLQVDDHRHARNTFLVLEEILKEEGFSGVYRGWLSMASTMFVSSFVYFYTYAGLQFCHRSLLTGEAEGLPRSSPPSSTLFIDLVLAFLAGVVNVLVTTPLWVANTRLKLQGAKLHTADLNKTRGTSKQPRNMYTGILDCLLKMIKYEGISKLWGGTVPSIILATNPAIQFMFYEALKRYFRRHMNATELSGLMYFILGAVAKTAATVVTYPLQVIQSRLRAGFAKEESAKSLRQNILHLIRTRGVGALYKGLEAKLLQTVLTAALMFAIYEKIAALIFRIMDMKQSSS